MTYLRVVEPFTINVPINSTRDEEIIKKLDSDWGYPTGDILTADECIRLKMMCEEIYQQYWDGRRMIITTENGTILY